MACKMPSSPPCEVLSFAKRMRPSLRRRDGSGALFISAAVLLDRAGGGHMSYAVMLLVMLRMRRTNGRFCPGPAWHFRAFFTKTFWCRVTSRSLGGRRDIAHS